MPQNAGKFALDQKMMLVPRAYTRGMLLIHCSISFQIVAISFDIPALQAGFSIQEL
jgi:hypothetical protein